MGIVAAGRNNFATAAAQARTDLGALADEQAALRRVAELVARGETPAREVTEALRHAERAAAELRGPRRRYRRCRPGRRNWTHRFVGPRPGGRRNADLHQCRGPRHRRPHPAAARRIETLIRPGTSGYQCTNVARGCPVSTM
jgi:hypothetical protein